MEIGVNKGIVYFLLKPSKDEQALEELLATAEEEAWEWSEISLVIAAVTSLVFVFAALYLIRAHKKQWNKMQQMDKGRCSRQRWHFDNEIDKSDFFSKQRWNRTFRG